MMIDNIGVDFLISTYKSLRISSPMHYLIVLTILIIKAESLKEKNKIHK